MILDSHGMPISEISDLVSGSNTVKEGIEELAREHPHIVEVALPHHDFATRREMIFRAQHSLREFGANLIALPSELVSSAYGLFGLAAASAVPISRRASFLALAGLIATAAGYSPRIAQAQAIDFKLAEAGFPTDIVGYIPVGPHISDKDYPLVQGSLSNQSIPRGYHRHLETNDAGGIDFNVSTKDDTKIVPCAFGVVRFAERTEEGGYTVRIRHGLNYLTSYAHMMTIAINPRTGKKWAKGEIVTPADVIGFGGNRGVGAKSVYHLHLSFWVPTHHKPHDSITIGGNTYYTADPAHQAEYCVVGKDIGGGKRVKICNFSINYMQSQEYDTSTWRKDKEFRGLLRELKDELGVSGRMKPVIGHTSVWDLMETLKGRLQDGFGGKLKPSIADSYLKRLEAFMNHKLILTAPIANPYMPELYKKAA